MEKILNEKYDIAFCLVQNMDQPPQKIVFGTSTTISKLIPCNDGIWGNFINILRALIPNAQKRQSSQQCFFFALSGPICVKAAGKTLMKLMPHFQNERRFVQSLSHSSLRYRRKSQRHPFTHSRSGKKTVTSYLRMTKKENFYRPLTFDSNKTCKNVPSNYLFSQVCSISTS